MSCCATQPGDHDHTCDPNSTPADLTSQRVADEEKAAPMKSPLDAALEATVAALKDELEEATLPKVPEKGLEEFEVIKLLLRKCHESMKKRCELDDHDVVRNSQNDDHIHNAQRLCATLDYLRASMERFEKDLPAAPSKHQPLLTKLQPPAPHAAPPPSSTAGVDDPLVLRIKRCIKRCIKRWFPFQWDRNDRKVAMLMAQLEALYLQIQHKEMVALLWCQIGMLVSVWAAYHAYYQGEPRFLSPVNNTDYHPDVTKDMTAMEKNQLRSLRWAPIGRGEMKSPAAAGANFCYIACGAGILLLPWVNNAASSDVNTLLAFNMIFLGLASYSFHYHGDVLEHWSHRADLTFILIMMGSLPFLAVNGLCQAFRGSPAMPADWRPVLAKGGMFLFSGFAFIFQEEIYSANRVITLGVVVVIINNLSLIIMARQAMKRVKKATVWTRFQFGYQAREPREAREPGNCKKDNPKWENEAMRPSDFCWMYHETWSALELALPRASLGLATIAVAYLVNSESDVYRDAGWGDQNLTAQWYIDVELTQDDIDAAIEKRKVYDFMHGGWQFLSALFLMQQTLAIMEATNGNIQNILHYSSKAEWYGVLQAWAIIIALLAAWLLEADSDIFFTLWVVITGPGILFSAVLLSSCQSYAADDKDDPKMVLLLPVVPRSFRSRESLELLHDFSHDFLIGPDFDDLENRHRRRSSQRSPVQPGGESSAPLCCGTVTTAV